MTKKEKLRFICNFYRGNYKKLKFKLTTYALVGLAHKMPISRFSFESLKDEKAVISNHLVEFRHLNEFKNIGILELRGFCALTERKSGQKECNEYVPGVVGKSLLGQLPSTTSITKKQLINRYIGIKDKHERATYSTLAILSAMQLGATTHEEIAIAIGRSMTSLGASISRGAYSHGYIELSHQQGRTKFWNVSKKGKELLNLML